MPTSAMAQEVIAVKTIGESGGNVSGKQGDSVCIGGEDETLKT